MSKIITDLNESTFIVSDSRLTKVLKNIKYQLKKVLILLVLFGALFGVSFYVVNFLDVKPAAKTSALQTVSGSDFKANDEQLKKKLGSSSAGLAGFADWAEANNLSGTDIYSGDADGEGLANYLEYIHGTDPNNVDTDGDKFSDMKEITNGYDPDAYGEIMTAVSFKIEKLGVIAPMVWSKTDVEAEMLEDLEDGLAHFTGTASPGQNGNSIISGHSSNYIWAKGNYNHIFKDLNNLESGDVITAKTIQKNGRIISYQYKVSEKYITAPDDERIFENSAEPTLTLSTCWPLGTNLKRIIVKAELVK